MGKREPERRGAAGGLEVYGSVVKGGTRLRWKAVRRAKAYAVEWRDGEGEWWPVETLRDDEIVTDAAGFMEFTDTCAGPAAPGGPAYRVIAFFSASLHGRHVTSSIVQI